MYRLGIILIIILINGCKPGQRLDGTYDDGVYCAKVEYENPNTGTISTYNLNVEVEDNFLICIQFPNGGYLDTDHFEPAELDEDGICTFKSDEENEYAVTILGPKCTNTDFDSYANDLKSDRSEVTCPKCGEEKYSFDDYCDDCEDLAEELEEELEEEKEETCPKCGNDKYSFDDYCDDCEEKADEIEEAKMVKIFYKDEDN
jgi:hypothetical protein